MSLRLQKCDLYLIISWNKNQSFDKGYKVKEIYKIWHFDQVSQYDHITKSGGIFRLCKHIFENQTGG
jgi:hypothetical protein